MRRFASVTLIVAALAASMFGVAPAQAADRVIATATVIGDLEAHGGNVVWGEAGDEEEPLRYFVRDARGTRRIPLENPFNQDVDFDLGAREGGGTVAVFTRCPGNLRNCVLRTYDFRSGATRTLSSLARLRGSERSPSVWKGRFAFARELLGRLNHNGRPGVPGRKLGLFATNPLKRVTGAETLPSPDLRGRLLAYLTTMTTGRGPPGLAIETTTLRLARLPSGPGRVRSCFIARATASTAPGARQVFLGNPVLTGSHLYWRRVESFRSRESTATTIRRRRLPARGCRSGGPEERSRALDASSFSVEGRRFFYTTHTQLREATDPPLTFTR